MSTISYLLNSKGTDVWSVTPNTSTYQALLLMAEKNIGAVMVLDHDKLAGIFSERDYVRAVNHYPEDVSVKKLPVKEVMTTKVVCVGPSCTIEESMALMTEKRVRHLPIIEQERLVGIISIGDVVKWTISQQEFLIEQLETYVMQL